MACTYVLAEDGYKWTPTEAGLKENRIAAKYRKDYVQQKQYNKKVPESWVKQGWVKQVRI